MAFAANFTAIDFETANRQANSACQLAAVVVRDGQITDQWMWMIRPEPFYFSPANIRIHGISPQTVQNEPTFGEVWPDIAEKLAGDVLIAHNANFDIGVLLNCLATHQLEVPQIEYSCTRAIARQTWPHRPRFGLKPLADWLGIRFKHHDALEDSVACAKVLLAAGIDREAKSLADLEKQLRLSRGQAGSWGHKGPSRSGRSRKKKPLSQPPKQSDARQPMLPFLFPNQVQAANLVRSEPSSYQTPISPSVTAKPASDAIDLQRLMLRAEFIRPLSGLQIVISGRLQTMNQEQAETLATKSGGSCQTSVDDSTDLVVANSKTQIDDANRPVKVVTEDEFLAMVVNQTNP